jgi:uncharacterized SAM-binding protein YcdF (DUF218 family)
LFPWIEDKSINTADEAKFILPLLLQNKIHTIYLITNAWHMPRSMQIFNFYFSKFNINVIPAPMGYVGISEKRETVSIMDFLPWVQALEKSSIAMQEYIGMIWYKWYYQYGQNSE